MNAAPARQAAERAGSGLFESKLHPPAIRPEAVSRAALVNRLRGARRAPVAALVAPAGYGKTSVLAQWAHKDARPFAWLSVDEGDNDPVVFLRYLAGALGRIESIGASLASLRVRRSSLRTSAVTRIVSAFSAAAEPFVLVLDDIHTLNSKECIEVVATLAEQVPEGSTLVLSGRVLPRLRIARWRASGRLVEIGADQLALTRREADLLLRGTGVELAETEVATLTKRTEGWGAGLYLAALALERRDETHVSALSFGGNDRFVTDYFRSEYLSRVPDKDVRFLTRTAILDQMSGPLCDAVLEGDGSGPALESIERSNLFLVPLDHQRDWYRYHHLFRDVLRAELQIREPELVGVLQARAAAWCETNGMQEAAIGYASRAGDLATVARLIGSLGLTACEPRGSALLESCFRSFEENGELERYPAVAVLGGWWHALRGRSRDAAKCLRAAERGKSRGVLPDGSRSVTPWIALLRAALCRDGPKRMLADAELGLRELAAESGWRPTALLLHGAACLLLDDRDSAEASLAEAANLAATLGIAATEVLAVAEQSLLAADRGDYREVEALAFDARALVDRHQLGGDAVSAIVFAASARAELRRGQSEQARTDLAKAHRLRPQLTDALPWYSVQTRLELARVHAALLDGPGADAMLSEIDEVLSRRPRLGVLSAQADGLRDEAPGQAGGSSILTPAELRLLPLLTTHMSFREIGERLCISRNTVKTQAISVYRKLCVSSRGEAIDRAAELGLVHRTGTGPPPTRNADKQAVNA